jgi:ribonuclease BN (tRNA processing enzyme)
LRITVLGKSPSWQDAAGACSGYLVQEGELKLLLDCGNGVFSKLRSVVDYRSVREVVISHLHADHFLDLVPFSYGLANAVRTAATGNGGSGVAHARPSLRVPSGGRAVLRRIVGSWGSEDLIDAAFEITEYGSDDLFALGPLQVRFREVPHFVRSHAVELATGGAGGQRFVFGADCAPNQALIEFAREADVLMLEATLPAPEQGPERGHMTPREAGEHGAAAHARRLVLTHYSDEMDPSWAAAEAADSYGGPVELAHEGAVYEL